MILLTEAMRYCSQRERNIARNRKEIFVTKAKRDIGRRTKEILLAKAKKYCSQ